MWRGAGAAALRRRPRRTQRQSGATGNYLTAHAPAECRGSRATSTHHAPRRSSFPAPSVLARASPAAAPPPRANIAAGSSLERAAAASAAATLAASALRICAATTIQARPPRPRSSGGGGAAQKGTHTENAWKMSRMKRGGAGGGGAGSGGNGGNGGEGGGGGDAVKSAVHTRGCGSAPACALDVCVVLRCESPPGGGEGGERAGGFAAAGRAPTRGCGGGDDGSRGSGGSGGGTAVLLRLLDGHATSTSARERRTSAQRQGSTCTLAARRTCATVAQHAALRVAAAIGVVGAQATQASAAASGERAVCNSPARVLRARRRRRQRRGRCAHTRSGTA